MGKGDKKTKRGKINIGSYGVTRPRKKKKSVATPIEKKEKPAKKEAASKEEKPKAEKPKAPKKAAAKKKEAEE